MARRKGTLIEVFRSVSFDAEILFNRNSGEFTAELPGGEQLRDPQIDKLRGALTKAAREFAGLGAWKKKILICLDWESDFSSTIGGLHMTTSRLELSWVVFEERENPPSGKRIARARGDRGQGSDLAWALDDRRVIDWTPGRESALMEITDALKKLGERLAGMMDRPEFIAAAIPQLSAGKSKG